MLNLVLLLCRQVLGLDFAVSESLAASLGACTPGLTLPRVESEPVTQRGPVPTGHPAFPLCLLEAGGICEALGDLGTAALAPKTRNLTFSSLLSRWRPASAPLTSGHTPEALPAPHSPALGRGLTGIPRGLHGTQLCHPTDFSCSWGPKV